VAFRENPLGELKVPLTWTAAVAVIVAAVVAITLLATDRRGTIQAEAYGVTRRAADSVAAPVGGFLSGPIGLIEGGVDAVRGYFFAISENRRLKAELKEAHEWRDAALALRNTNERYRVLLGLKTDPPIPMISARVVTDTRGPFANTRLANAGVEKGVKPGYPVMGENGLVGRVIGVTTGASRVLLLTDISSRTPVMIDRTNARAILTGDGGPNPKLEYLRGQNPVQPGDRVVTSGDGGVLPRGLPVGVAAKGLDGRWRVVLASDSSPVDYVRILQFEDFSQLVNHKELDQMPVPPPSTREAATIGVTAAPSTGASPTAPAGGAVPPAAGTPPRAATAPVTTATPAPKAAASPAPNTAARPAPKAAIPTAPSPKPLTPTPQTASPAAKAAAPASKTTASPTPKPAPKAPAPKPAAKSEPTPAAKAAPAERAEEPPL
jgi:rod shape-determining protein MreC